jgi:hypothetical protein
MANPEHEYVVGGLLGWSPSIYTLGWDIDDVTAQFGDDLYERMMLDAEVSKNVNIMKMAILDQGLFITPGKKKGEDGYAKSLEICDFVRRNLADLDAPFEPTNSVPMYWQLWDLLDGIVLGNKVAELLFEIPKAGPDTGRLCLKMIKPKPRRALVYVVDAYLNVWGFLALQAASDPKASNSSNGNGNGKGVSPDAQVAGVRIPYLANQRDLLPRRKFIIFSFRPRNGDPRGQSVARPAFNAWNLKQQNWPAFLKFLSQFSTPSLLGKPAPGAVAVVLVGPDGKTPLRDTAGKIITVSPERSLMEVLEKFQNSSVLVVPPGAEVDTIESKRQESPHQAAIELLNREISNAILNQTLATGESQFMARAASQVHQDILGLVIGHGKLGLASTIRADIVRSLVEWNYGPQALSLLPKVSLSETEQQDFAANAHAMAALGYKVDPSQYDDIDARLNLPPRASLPQAPPAAGAPGASAPASASELRQLLGSVAQGPGRAPDAGGALDAPISNAS